MGGEEEEEDRGISVIVGGAGEECVREGREWGKQMVFHFYGGGRSWGPDPRLVTVRRRWAMFQKEET